MGFPSHVVDSAFGPGALPRLRGVVAHLRREAHQLRHEAALVRDDPTAEAAAVAVVLDIQAAEIEARIDAVEAVIAP